MHAFRVMLSVLMSTVFDLYCLVVHSMGYLCSSFFNLSSLVSFSGLRFVFLAVQIFVIAVSIWVWILLSASLTVSVLESTMGITF